MLKEINERLMSARKRVRSARKIESMLREAREILESELKKCAALEERCAAEKNDVDKLEGLSLAGLFHSVLGTKKERMKEEQREYLAAQLKHEESALVVEEARNEVQRLEDELSNLGNADAEYDAVIRQKQDLLVGATGAPAEQLLTLSENLADLKSDGKELQEAIRAGNSALSALQLVSSELKSAANWGTWDMFGGGMVSSMIKHSKIDTAKEHAHRAQQQLTRFREELADAGQRLKVSIEIGGFSKFADFFFDGLIADWMVQSKIREASTACSDTITLVTAALQECRRRLEETENQTEGLGAQRLKLIEEAL